MHYIDTCITWIYALYGYMHYMDTWIHGLHGYMHYMDALRGYMDKLILVDTWILDICITWIHG